MQTSALRSAFGIGVALALAVTLLSACGGGSNERDRTKAQVRLLNASAYAALDLRLDGTVRQSLVGYGDSAVYVEVDTASVPAHVTPNGSATALQAITMGLERDKRTTLLAYGPEGALKLLQLDDNLAAPAAGRSTLRVVNAAPDAGSLDVYVTASGDALATAVPLRAGVVVGAVATTTDATPATWRLRVTAAGSKTDVRLDLPALSLADRGVATLVLSAARGGALVNALVLPQGGGITRADNIHARVRVAAGLAGGAVASARVGDVTLASSLGAPAVSTYQLVPAGTRTVLLSVDGTPLAPTEQLLPPGTDHTLLFSGTAGVPRADWIADDNTLPVTTGSAKLRLVHGLAGLAGTMSLTSDFLPVASGVARGRASVPTAVTATTTAKLNVTGAGQPTALFSAIDQRLDAGAVYTVFVVGDLAAPVGILRKDR